MLRWYFSFERLLQYICTKTAYRTWYVVTVPFKRLLFTCTCNQSLWPRPQSNAGTPMKRPRCLIKNLQFWHGVFFWPAFNRGPTFNQENMVHVYQLYITAKEMQMCWCWNRWRRWKSLGFLLPFGQQKRMCFCRLAKGNRSCFQRTT